MDLRDVDVDRVSKSPPTGGRIWPWILLGFGAVLLVAGAGVWILRDRAAPSAAQVPAVATQPPPIGRSATDDTARRASPSPARSARSEAPSPPAEPLPRLDDSDSLLRALVARLSSHPRLVAWLASEDLIRRFVASVDNVAHGASPAAHIGFLMPRGTFRVSGGGEVAVVDPQTYARYDLATEVFTSLDATGVARLYQRLEPLVDEAYRDLGYPGEDFDGTLTRAIQELLAAPIVEGEVAVFPLVTTWEFSDLELAALSPAQRQLLRMGPENVERVQTKLREIAAALGIARDQLPERSVYAARAARDRG